MIKLVHIDGAAYIEHRYAYIDAPIVRVLRWRVLRLRSDILTTLEIEEV